MSSRLPPLSHEQVPGHTCVQEFPGSFDCVSADGNPCPRCDWMKGRLADLLPELMAAVSDLNGARVKAEQDAARDKFAELVAQTIRDGLSGTLWWHLACCIVVLRAEPVSVPRDTFKDLSHADPQIFGLVDDLLRAAAMYDPEAATAVFAAMGARKRAQRGLPQAEGSWIDAEMTFFVVLCQMGFLAFDQHTQPQERIAHMIALRDAQRAVGWPVETLFAARIGGAIAQGREDLAQRLVVRANRQNLLGDVCRLLAEAIARHVPPGGGDQIHLMLTPRDGGESTLYTNVDDIPVGESMEAAAQAAAIRYVTYIADGDPNPEARMSVLLAQHDPQLLLVIAMALAKWWSQRVGGVYKQYLARCEARQQEQARRN